MRPDQPKVLIAELKSRPDLERCDLLAYATIPDTSQDDKGFTCWVELNGIFETPIAIRADSHPDCFFSAIVFIEETLCGKEATKRVFFLDGSEYSSRLVTYANALQND